MSRFAGWFVNLKVQNKILVGFAVVLLLMAIVAAVVITQAAIIADLNRETARTEEIRHESEMIGTALVDRTAAYRDYLLTGQEPALVAYRDADNRIRQAVVRAGELIRDSLQQARLDTIADFAQQWEQEVGSVGIALRAGDPLGPVSDTVTAFVRGGAGARGGERARIVVERFQERATVLSQNARFAMTDSLENIRWATLIGMLIAVILAIAVAVWIARTIAGPLTRAVDFAAGVAAGDLTQRLPDGGTDEIGNLGSTLNAMAG
ncbi:MAG: CHASE3 domain-containing protein, partial [Gemmatimonadetes bacterium]|nr:CHASE3 domain-containing protein [Gemmatimonadota bacterium]